MRRRPSAKLLHPRYWPSWLGLALLRLLSLLPLRLISLLGAGLGMLLYALHAERRRIVRINIERCFPELGVRGRSHYEQALAQRRNIILLAPHFLGLEWGGIRLSMERPMVTVFRHPMNEPLRFAMERARARFQLRLVEHVKPLTTLVRQVKAGAPLYYLPDQDAGRRNAVFAPFFGTPAATFAVLPRLADMTGAVVIPCVTRQLPWGRGYEIVFRPPLKNFPSGDAVADATRMNREIEECVREAPEQYFWLHKRFKTRPEGEKNFYRD